RRRRARSLRSGATFQDRHGGVAPRGSHDAAARMRARAALVKTADRRAISRPGGRGTQEEHLLQAELTLEDIALGEADDALDVGRSDDLPMNDRSGQIRRVFGKRIYHRIAELLTPRIAPAVAQV